MLRVPFEDRARAALMPLMSSWSSVPTATKVAPPPLAMFWYARICISPGGTVTNLYGMSTETN